MALTNDVAIIGIGVRAPSSPNLEALWLNLVEGRDCITFFDKDELETNRDLIGNPAFVMAAGLLGGIDQFDAEFFGLSPRDAALMHPQHRLFLECAWEAFEDAGYDVRTVPSRVSVYGGQSGTSEYLPGDPWRATLASELPECERVYVPFSNHLTARVSHALGLTGESIEIRAACATGLVAVNMGCRSLLSGDADLSLVGSAHVFVPERTGYLVSQNAFRFSPDGRCHAFDHRARGLVHTSAVGTLLLKRLDDAVRDHDPIYAVIKGVAVNNDGASRSTYVTPGLELQAECVAEAQIAADVPAESITYVEAHGIAVPMADAIEVEAMRRAFAAQTSRKRFSGLGSVKANIGHTGASAGMMGLIKAALALKHGVIPPQINFERAHPNLNLHDSPFEIYRSATPWNPPDSPRRAGVHAFGMGGTNAHAVLEAAPPSPSTHNTAKPRIIALSARNPAALDAVRQRLIVHLESHPDQALGDIAYTLALGRAAQSHRWAVVVGSRDELRQALQDGPEAEGSFSSQMRSVFDLQIMESLPAGNAAASLRLPNIDARSDRNAVRDLASMWVAGTPVDWLHLFEGEVRKRIHLPTYPFQRERHWLDSLETNVPQNCSF